MTPAHFGRPVRPVQTSLFPFMEDPPGDGFGTLDLFATATDTPEEDPMPAENTPPRPADATTATVPTDGTPEPRNAAQRPTQPIAVRVTAAVLAAVHPAAGLNEYGSCITPGFAIALGTDDQARVHHQMPNPDLTDPDRLSSHERWAEQRDHVAAYAATLRADGFVVDERTVPTGPILLTTPPEAYPCRIAVFCDECRVTVSHDYLVHDAMTKAQRLQVARDHLTANEGWSCTDGEDLCGPCAAAVELADLRDVDGPLPAQLRRMAELVELLEDAAAARPVWERAAAAGDRDAIDYVAVLVAEAGACTLCDVVKPDVWALRDHVANVHPDDYCRIYHGPECH
jgi:hypothetical protein